MREKARQRDADTMPYSIKRELRVVFSKNRSPIPLRIAKRVVILIGARRLYGTRWFWARVGGLPLAGLGE